MTDEELLRRIAGGSYDAMEELLRRRGGLLRYVIGGILPDPRDREECYNDVCLLLWDRADSFDPGLGRAAPWLTTVARNAAVNRRNARRTGADLPLREDTAAVPSPEEDLLRRERARQLWAAVRNLDAGERQLFYRKYYYLQSQEQMARELGCTERAVEGRLYRLRRKLRKLLGGEGDD